MKRASFTSRYDSVGHAHVSKTHAPEDHGDASSIPSLTYTRDESDVWRAHMALNHYHHRGQFWNSSKHDALFRYFLITLTAMLQGVVAYLVNICSLHLIEYKFRAARQSMEQGNIAIAGLQFVLFQLLCALFAGCMCYWKPVAAGSGIPETKCFLNGIDLPDFGTLSTLTAKVMGVVGSVSAGLPVGKEGPMVHSGAILAHTLASGQTRNDLETRDLVACGAAVGVCTAFSAPIGGILFALEEGTSFWSKSLTWRAFFASMVAFTTLLTLNSVASEYGKVGYNKLFSFGNFIYEQTGLSSFAVYELSIFVCLGAVGGLIGALFNHANQQLTIWRMKHVNYSKQRRFVEVLCLSLLTSSIMFGLPWIFRNQCTKIPTNPLTDQEAELFEELVRFTCPPGYYNQLASLFFTEPSVAIRQLFHLHHHAFSEWTLFLFFLPYISLAAVVYGMAVPSGLFVPSLLSGAAFGRLLGNVALRLYPERLASSNVYALVGAAAVLGGMARMTISLTVILLECTGNEMYVLPLMLTLMTARLVGQLFNSDLYHIHIHFKKGVNFLESELVQNARHQNLIARQIMSEKVVFARPVERVSNVVDMLLSCKHSFFPIVDPNDSGVLIGTIGRNELCVLLKQRAFGHPLEEDDEKDKNGNSHRFQNNFLEYQGHKFFPLVDWNVLEKAYPKYPRVEDIRLHRRDRDCFMDLRPYANTSPISIQETATLGRTYDLFRNLAMRFLVVVNRHNQVVGTITRVDLSSESLAQTEYKKNQ